jgi:DeoR family transcriptional regulator of aga operon
VVSAARANGRRHLVPEERRRQILELLRERGSISVADVEEGFGVSPMTARRDLEVLAEAGRARRTHGGAVLPELTAHEDSFENRLEQDVDEKVRLAKVVAATVQPHEAVFIDSSSTAHYVLRALLEMRLPATVVTNSLPAITAFQAADATNAHLIGLGGGLRSLTRSFVGPETVRAVREVFVDRLIFSVMGIEPGGFLTDPDPLEAQVKRAMIERARTVVLVTGGRKFDERGLHLIAHASSVDLAYVADPPNDGLNALESAGVVVNRV